MTASFELGLAEQCSNVAASGLRKWAVWSGKSMYDAHPPIP